MGKNMGYILQKQWDKFAKTMGYIQKTLVYIGQKEWDILG